MNCLSIFVYIYNSLVCLVFLSFISLIHSHVENMDFEHLSIAQAQNFLFSWKEWTSSPFSCIKCAQTSTKYCIEATNKIYSIWNPVHHSTFFRSFLSLIRHQFIPFFVCIHLFVLVFPHPCEIVSSSHELEHNRQTMIAHHLPFAIVALNFSSIIFSNSVLSVGFYSFPSWSAFTQLLAVRTSN